MPGTSGPVRPDAAADLAGERVRQRRKAIGLSQQALATAVGVSRQTIITMEQGNYAPSVYLALRVAGALESEVEALWG
ncbi:MAG: helix-turn-helix transcriptional regulator [Acidimicrobiia bacterium]|nr:helix-turn-helix transcriptional regulator [Acidimicrobiia bacterium]